MKNQMRESARDLIRPTFLYDVIRYIRQKQNLRDWESRGHPVPLPSLLKQRVVREYAEEFTLHILVETGTWLGDMVYATRNTFSRIFSIELDEELCERARSRFSRFDHISIVQGDSGEVLPEILANITRPCLFWLDGHAMVDGVRGKLITPIRQELHHVLNHSITDHVILIDDARLFVGRADYPTIEEVKGSVLNRHPEWVFTVRDDIIRAHRHT